MNKSIATNGASLLFILLGQFSPVFGPQLSSIGYFAFSGAITNWLAIHMLFEKVPGLYGSGVIPNRFVEFKAGIKSLVMDQFFTEENIRKFFHDQTESSAKSASDENGMFAKVIASIDMDRFFSDLVEVVLQSPLGGMLGMMGGKAALDPLKQPFIEKMRQSLLDITQTEQFREAVGAGVDALPDGVIHELYEKIASIVNKRLEELTPETVKTIIQEMIRIHLGWLVVWGGVFGGLIGLIKSVIYP